MTKMQSLSLLQSQLRQEAGKAQNAQGKAQGALIDAMLEKFNQKVE